MSSSTGETLSLRPLSLRPGSGANLGPAKNPFAAFGAGAGAGARRKPVEDAVDVPEVPSKPRSEVIVYAVDFLQSFQEKCTRMPEGLEAGKSIVLEAAAISAGRPPMQPPSAPGPVVDNREWRSQQAPSSTAGAAQGTSQPSTAPAAKAGNQAGPAQDGKPAAAAPAAAAASAKPPQASGPSAIARLADQGKTAWKPSSSMSDNQKAAKTVKGILNKLTPETFDKLLERLKTQIINTEVLHASIAMVFESAVAQPTFVNMYAELCVRLSKELPDVDESGRTRAFQRVLLNTCQEEFEGAEDARRALATTGADDLEVAQRKLKQRMLGNVRLLAELFKQKALGEKIMHACLAGLIGDPKGTPEEDNVEAVCETFTIAGKALEETTREKRRTDSYWATLDRWGKSPALAPRIRFLVRDVLDLRRAKWVPRREGLKAKKLTEVRAEAHAELGMVPPPPVATLPAMPLLQAALVGQPVPEVELFPAFKGSEAGWEKLAGKGQQQANGNADASSALLGDYIAPDIFVPAEPEPPPIVAETVDARPDKTMDEEGKKKAVKLLLTEFASSFDRKEATTCVRELGEDSGMLVLEASLDAIFDAQTQRAAQELSGLVVHLVTQQVVPATLFLDLVASTAETLEDLRLDIPKAPQLLAGLHAQGIAASAVPLASLQDVAQRVEDMTDRRDYAVSVLQALQMDDKTNLGQLCKEADFRVGSFLDGHDAQPSAAKLLESKGLSEAVL